MTDLKELYRHTAHDTTVRLVEAVSEAFNDYPGLIEPCLYLITAGGKRVRAIIPMAFCGAICGKPDRAVRVGMAMELIHTFTLIHDDIMDNSDTRRGVTSVHKMFGVPTAINAGNALFSLALEVLNYTPLPAMVMVEMTRVALKACADLAMGQQLDLYLKKKRDVSWADYMRVNKLKTAPLFATAARLGVLAAGGTMAQVIFAEEWGKCFGISFQVRDDALDQDPPGFSTGEMHIDLEEEAEIWKLRALDALENLGADESFGHMSGIEWYDSLEALTNWQVTRSE